jgi:hypothetical protein
MPRRTGFVWSRVPVSRRARRGYRVEFFHGQIWQAEYVPWSHYDLACDYLTRHGLALNDVGEVLVNFTEDELRTILNQEVRHDA